MSGPHAPGWRVVLACFLGMAMALAVHAACFPSWAAFHAGIDFNREPFEDFMGPYFKQAMAMHGDQSLQPGFLYPPSFALFLAPLGALSGWAASWTWAGVLALATAFLMGAVMVDRRPTRAAHALGWAFLFGLSFPWVHDMHWGQVSTLLWACTLGGLAAWRHGRPWWGALGLSLGIAIKLFPAWFLIAFALRGDWRGIARVAFLTSVFLFLVPWIWMGSAATQAFYADLLEWWRGSLQELFWESEGSQFAPAVLMRLWGAPEGILRALAWGLPIALALWILWRVRGSIRRGDTPRGLVLLASALPLVLSPSWSHYFVWLPWGLWWFWHRIEGAAARSALVGSAALMSTPFFLLVGGHPAYPLGGYLTLAALALPLADALDRSDRSGSPAQR